MTTENREPKPRAEEWLDDLMRRVQMLRLIRHGLRPRGRPVAKPALARTELGELNRRKRNTAFVEALRQHHPEREKPLGSAAQREQLLAEAVSGEYRSQMPRADICPAAVKIRSTPR